MTTIEVYVDLSKCYFYGFSNLKKVKYTWFTVFQVYSKMIQLYISYAIHIFFRFFSITIGYYKILNIVPSAI